MKKIEINRQFILSFYHAISSAIKTEKLLSRFTSDQKLINHIMYLENLFPKFKLLIDEITAEDERVVVKARVYGKHSGKTADILPTGRMIEIPLAIGYVIDEKTIIDHWLIIDYLELLEKMGIIKSIQKK